jgi:hypothetical protein
MMARSSSEPDRDSASAAFDPLTSETTKVALADSPRSLVVRKGIFMLSISVSFTYASGTVCLDEPEPDDEEDFKNGRRCDICSVSFFRKFSSGDGLCPNAAFAK